MVLEEVAEAMGEAVREMGCRLRRLWSTGVPGTVRGFAPT